MKNYALIIKGVQDLLVESFESKDSSTVNKVLKEIKNNTKFKFLYALVDNLTNGVVQPDSVDEFIKENIKVAQTIDFSKFNKLITENSKSESNELLDNIGIILFEKKTVLNMSDYNKAYDFVKNHLISENTWEKEYRTHLSEYSKKYVTMDNDDKTLFEQFLKTGKNNRVELFDKMVKDCIQTLTEHLQQVTDKDLRLKLLESKEALSNYKFENENFVQKMVNIHELKKSLI